LHGGGGFKIIVNQHWGAATRVHDRAAVTQTRRGREADEAALAPDARLHMLGLRPELRCGRYGDLPMSGRLGWTAMRG
jgi:hypothetical protein